MEKISTLYEKDPDNLGRVVPKLNPINGWVVDGLAIATRKFDGTAVSVIGGELYKRYDAKIDKETGKYIKGVPGGAIECQDADPVSGHHPHWVKCDRQDSSNKWHFIAFDARDDWSDGTYELCGEKIQGNPENIKGHELIKHGVATLNIGDITFDNIKKYLKEHDIEGIVFHHKNWDRMCKIRKKDFGFKRNKITK